MMCGGFGSAKNADAEVQALCDEVRQLVEAQLNTTLNAYEAVNYQTQVVAGLNYLVKVRTGENEYTHVKIHKPLPHNGTELQLMSATQGHNLETPLI